MRRVVLLICWQFAMLAGGRLFADVVTLKDGHQISGLVETGNIQQLHIKVGDQSQTIDVHEVQAIQFGISLPVPPVAPPAAKAADVAPRPARAGALVAGAVVAGAVALIGIVGIVFARIITGQGVANSPFTDGLAQTALLDSKRGRQ